MFACISTFGEDWICTFESSNPYTWLKQPNVIYENRSKIFEIWVAKKPDISGFFGHVINLVMTICLGITKLMTFIFRKFRRFLSPFLSTYALFFFYTWYSIFHCICQEKNIIFQNIFQSANMYHCSLVPMSTGSLFCLIMSQYHETERVSYLSVYQYASVQDTMLHNWFFLR